MMSHELSPLLRLPFTLVSLLLLPFLAMKTLEIFLTVKKSRIRRLCLYASLLLLTGMKIYIGDLMNLPPTIAVFLVCVLISCEGTALRRFTLGLILAGVAFSFNTLMDNYLYFRIGDPFSAKVFYLSFFLRLLFWLSLFLLARRFGPERDYELSPSLWRLLLFLTLAPVGTILSLVLLSPENYMDAPGAFFLYPVLLLLSSLSLCGLFFIVTVLAKQKKLEEQSALFEMNRKYYEMMEQRQTEVRRLKHDMANHLQVLSALPCEEKEDYLRALTESPALSQPLCVCGDPAVNAVLSMKNSRMEEEGIDFKASIKIDAPLPFEKTDICAIFANALDNAVEACRTLTPDRRRIRLKARLEKGLFVLEMKNSCLCREKLPSFQDKTGKSRDCFLPKTTKKDASGHGYGLKSILASVRRYGGSMNIRTVPPDPPASSRSGTGSCKDGYAVADVNSVCEFILFLYIPVPGSAGPER